MYCNNYTNGILLNYLRIKDYKQYVIALYAYTYASIDSSPHTHDDDDFRHIKYCIL